MCRLSSIRIHELDKATLGCEPGSADRELLSFALTHRDWLSDTDRAGALDVSLCAKAQLCILPDDDVIVENDTKRARCVLDLRGHGDVRL